ncbi:MAG: isocitrate/isopropylmalate dehydrogenase family protein [Chloroflexota bacterium]
MSIATVPIAVLLGDGIGPDVVSASMMVLGEAGRRRGIELDFAILPSGLDAVETHGSTLPAEALAALSQYPGWILGPVATHLYPPGDPRFINVSGRLRKQFDLYANIRPARSFAGLTAAGSDIDLVIVRENTEGFYADRNVLDGNGELRPDEDTVISVRVVTRRACMRVARQAFELARLRNGRRRVTAIHKANVLRRGDGLFLECCRDVGAGYPDISMDDCHVDACAMFLITRGSEFDVLVTTNMFGDILSDEAAGLVGGLGLAPSLNQGDDRAMAQAVHGSAPDIAAHHIANPVAQILSGKLLLDWLSAYHALPVLREVATSVEAAVADILVKGLSVTPDLGGTATTREMARAIKDELA